MTAADTAPEPGAVCAVTGGNRGIGAAVVALLLERGYRVAALSRSGEGPADALCVPCDVSSVESVDAAFKTIEAEYGPVEIVVSNAGVVDDTLLLTMSEETFARVVDTNLTGAYRVAKRAARSMVRARRGRLIFISSVVGLLGSAGQANYAASKAGLVGLARSLARELGSRGITSNVVAPGPVRTDMMAALTEQQQANTVANVPLGRMAEPREVAEVVAFLAGPGASYVTGAVVPVDGGLGMGH